MQNRHGVEITLKYPEIESAKAKKIAAEKMKNQLGNLNYFHHVIFECGVEYGLKLGKEQQELSLWS
ncbi:MAG: hypothetical protein IKU15_04905 [Clostridia bacterium]|nr:hypothetical protein [Clostridia bacterium]